MILVWVLTLTGGGGGGGGGGACHVLRKRWCECPAAATARCLKNETTMIPFLSLSLSFSLSDDLSLSSNSMPPLQDEHDSMQLNAGGGGLAYLASVAGAPSVPSCSS